MWYIKILFLTLVSCSTNECVYVNEHDTYELARMIQGECATCPIDERFALCLVAKNRTVIWNEPLQSVLDPNQFHGLCLPVTVTSENYKIADSVLTKGIVDSTLFFYKKDMVKTNWVSTLKVVKEYKYHNVCINK